MYPAYTGPRGHRNRDTLTVDTRRREPRSDTDFARKAEALIRSLAGVVHAHVLPTDHGDPGIDAIHVVAADHDAAAHMTGHVRSALLAGLATPIVPSRIHVRTAPGTDGAHRDAPSDDARTGSLPDTAGDATRPQRQAPVSRGRIRLIHAAERNEGNRRQDAAPATAPTEGRTSQGLAKAPGWTPPRRGARLVAVDVQKQPDGRVTCRVSIAWNAHVHRAEAVAMDLPGAAAQAAAQSAVRALAAAGIHGLELNGLREVEIAGREYVLVALRRTEGGSVRLRSGSALIVGTPERSAAEATLAAANDLL